MQGQQQQQQQQRKHTEQRVQGQARQCMPPQKRRRQPMDKPLLVECDSQRFKVTGAASLRLSPQGVATVVWTSVLC